MDAWVLIYVTSGCQAYGDCGCVWWDASLVNGQMVEEKVGRDGKPEGERIYIYMDEPLERRREKEERESLKMGPHQNSFILQSGERKRTNNTKQEKVAETKTRRDQSQRKRQRERLNSPPPANRERKAPQSRAEQNEHETAYANTNTNTTTERGVEQDLLMKREGGGGSVRRRNGDEDGKQGERNEKPPPPSPKPKTKGKGKGRGRANMNMNEEVTNNNNQAERTTHKTTHCPVNKEKRHRRASHPRKSPSSRRKGADSESANRFAKSTKGDTLNLEHSPRNDGPGSI
ncbi:hypothetical protein EDD18DRAFT_1417314 [Armillaria luteobubalina]|uniref:Uncharacterized protein n=1 Tax=Armillaria luteobubalina TaxID=153913 RepID=A0AA39PST1_9AGAR|nr:hypothetical protein EDD18DRAFT_1417314 [Armillaria luteobubalina]